jgi:hypothetical protein
VPFRFTDTSGPFGDVHAAVVDARSVDADALPPPLARDPLGVLVQINDVCALHPHAGATFHELPLRATALHPPVPVSDGAGIPCPPDEPTILIRTIDVFVQ